MADSFFGDWKNENRLARGASQPVLGGRFPWEGEEGRTGRGAFRGVDGRGAIEAAEGGSTRGGIEAVFLNDPIPALPT